MKYKPQTKEELIALLKNENIYLGDIDTSLITDMSGLFRDSKRVNFEGIENWDVSNVENMSYMFYNAVNFNSNINNWNVSKTEKMLCMFENAYKFNQPLDKWDTSNVLYMNRMFFNAKSFNQYIGSWNVFNAISLSYMFSGAESFNKSIEDWIINEACFIDDIFLNASSFKNVKSILNIYFLSKGNNRKKLLVMLETCDIKEVYKEVLKYNNNSIKDFIKKLENNYYDELNELIENKDSIISEYKKSKARKIELKDGEKYKPKNKIELLKLIKEKVKFAKIDTSLIKDMSGLFKNSKLKKFDGIETWDTSNAEDMHGVCLKGPYILIII